jgi:hypothetical protein
VKSIHPALGALGLRSGAQVDASVLTAVGKNQTGQTAYLAGDFLLDSFERFFPESIAG